MKAYLAQVKINIRLMVRDRSALFFSFLFPLIFFVLFAQAFHASENTGLMSQVISMVIIIGVLGNGFFGAGMRAVQDRETNVLRRFKVTPVGAAPILVASLVAGLVAFLPVVLCFFIIARVIYQVPLPPNLLSVLVFVSIAALAFRALGMTVAAVVNSMQEMQILTQLLYLPMLFLSGATFPVSMMPVWLQSVAQFLPATYLFQGMQRLLIGGEPLWRSLLPVVALVITLCAALLIGSKVFRWEKEEKIAGSAKLWIVAVMAPFLLMGVYQAYSRQNITRSRALTHDMYRRASTLLQNVKIFVGNGSVIERGAVLVRNGKISEVFGAPPANTKELRAEVVDASGKTLMPGLIDMHVHIGAPGGLYKDVAKYGDAKLAKRRLAAYLYSGVTAVRSTGDWMNQVLELRQEQRTDALLGAELFICGPLFTTGGGHPEELLKIVPEAIRETGRREFLREPQSPEEARRDVDALKQAGVDGIKAVLEAGNAQWGLFNRMDTAVYNAVIGQAAQDGLPSATHTGNLRDVNDAIAAGSGTIEHGAMYDTIPEKVFASMKARGVAYDPTLSVYRALAAARTGNTEPLERSLLQQVGPADMIEATRASLAKSKREDAASFKPILANIDANLLTAYRAGVLLITGSDAGNMLVVHGPTVQREMELWVQAGIPPAAALEAATYNAAKVLRADERIGLIQKGRDATFLLLDGDPTQDISVTEHINAVYYRGEHIDRPDLFEQDAIASRP